MNGTEEIDDHTAIRTATSWMAKVGKAIGKPGYEWKCARARNQKVPSVCEGVTKAENCCIGTGRRDSLADTEAAEDDEERRKWRRWHCH